MSPTLISLKQHLVSFSQIAGMTPGEVGELADTSDSLADFKTNLNEICLDNAGKTVFEILGDLTTRFATGNTPSQPAPSENSPLQNEIAETKKKIDKLAKREETAGK